MIYLLHLMSQFWYIVINWNPSFFFRFPWFLPNDFFSVPGSHLRYRITFNCLLSLDSSWLWQFLRLSLFIMTLTVVKNADQVYQRMLFCWNLSDILLMIRLGYERKVTEVKCHFHHVTSRVCISNVIYEMTLDIDLELAEIVFIRCLCFEVTFHSSSSYTVLLGRKLLWTAHICSVGSYVSSPRY